MKAKDIIERAVKMFAEHFVDNVQEFLASDSVTLETQCKDILDQVDLQTMITKQVSKYSKLR